jgi:molybdopterin/thiamine biosynthesis adenylyltransferase
MPGLQEGAEGVSEENPVMEDRYHRQRLIKGWDQEKLRNTRVLQIGAGAVGCETAKCLALAGVGEMTIVDLDTIEISNLNRQFLFRNEDVGREKAVVAAERLRALNPDITIVGIHEDITKKEPAFFLNFDIFLGCVDNIMARYFMNRMSVETKTPYIDAGTNLFFASLQTIIPGKTPCLECHSLYHGVGRMPCLGKDEKNPAISTTSGIIGGLQAQEALKVLLGLCDIEGGHIQYDTLNHNLTFIPLEKNVSCPICGDDSFATIEIDAMKSEDIVKELEIRLGRRPVLMKGKQLIVNTDTHSGETLIAIAGEKRIKIKIV